MIIVNEIEQLRKEILKLKNEGKMIGFVPTMGYLHDGHVSLIKSSVKYNDITVLSIFVNPIQFGENEDFSIYPRDLEHDLKIAKSSNVDIVFIPDIKELYPKGFATYVDVEEVTDKLCGKTRQGHFRGVATVVLKLFNIVEPNNAYFGQKDFQQCVVINKMVRDFNMKVNIRICPIVREKDGLALSSRNVYLNADDRNRAISLSRSLEFAKKSILVGEKDKQLMIKEIRKCIEEEGNCNIEYIEILNADNLTDIGDLVYGRIVIALAVKYGKTRLIDNITLEVK